MTNKLLHIGLHIIENDIESFYTNVLDCKIERTFSLQAEATFPIFNINKEVKIFYVNCNGIEFELFIGDKIDSPTFGHVCIQSSDAEKIFEKAKLMGYHTFIRKRNSKETYFIKDSNQNLFEIKKMTK